MHAGNSNERVPRLGQTQLNLVGASQRGGPALLFAGLLLPGWHPEFTSQNSALRAEVPRRVPEKITWRF